jgi:hypothetical protein
VIKEDEVKQEGKQVVKQEQDSIIQQVDSIIENEKKFQRTIRQIDENMKQTRKIQEEIDKSLDEIFSGYNQMIERHFKGSEGYKEIVNKMNMIYKIYGNRMYNASLLDLFSALYPVLRPLRGLKYKVIKGLGKIFRKSKKLKEDKLFCSQFVAIIYRELGLIDSKIDVKNFVPVDFLGMDEDGQKNIVSNIFKVCN